jgi:hypothetical protein
MAHLSETPRAPEVEDDRMMSMAEYGITKGWIYENPTPDQKEIHRRIDEFEAYRTTHSRSLAPSMGNSAASTEISVKPVDIVKDEPLAA